MSGLASLAPVGPAAAPGPAAAEPSAPGAAAAARVQEIEQLIAQLAHPGQAASFRQQLTAAALPGSTAGIAAAAVPALTPAPAATGAAVPYASLIDAAAAKYGVDPNVLRGLIRQESDFNPNSGSSAGAQGLTQLMPETAREFGITNPYDPAQSIDGGAHELANCLKAFHGDYTLALAAYNAGVGAVQKYGGVPPYAETQAYVRKVLAYADEYRRQAPATVTTPAPAAAAPTGGFGSYPVT